MKIAYQGAGLVMPEGLREASLVLDTRLGLILPPSTRPHRVEKLAGVYLYPALVNAHDHLDLNHYPRTRPRPCYTEAQVWAEDMTALLNESPFRELRRWSRRRALWEGLKKNRACGVGSVVQHNPTPRWLYHQRGGPRVVRGVTWAHSLYLSPPPYIQAAHRRGKRFFIHLAEGTGAESAQELSRLDALGCLSAKTVLVHGVGLRSKDIEWAVMQTAGLVWCPSTNFYLLGQTAQVEAWSQRGKLALGSDSRLTADGDLLDELRAAYATGQVSPQSLFCALTCDAARLVGFPKTGLLEAGYRADVLALPAKHADPYLNLILARHNDILWLRRDGRLIPRD